MRKSIISIAAISLLIISGCRNAPVDPPIDEPVKATGVSLDAATLSLAVDEYQKLTATITPENSTDKTITWTSSAPEIASVDATGLVTALGRGNATVTATTAESYQASCQVSCLRPRRIFASTWDLSNTVDNVLTIPLAADGSYDFTIDWGDGTIEEISSSTAQHTYSSNGPFTVEIDGTCEGFGFSSAGSENKDSLTDISQWGTMKLHSNGYQFYYCSSLLGFTAADAPDLSAITNMSHMFHNASFFNQDLSAWNTSQVNNFSNMFHSAGRFNGDISSWDISRAIDLSSMFHFAYDFDQDISAWDTSQATNMSYMFNGAHSFNQDISAWNTSRVMNMGRMFAEAAVFNQDVSAWNTSQVTDMNGMFGDAIAFNQDISAWDTSKVTLFGVMFYGADSFNQDISGWDTSQATYMAYMFMGALMFNQDISAWNTSKVTDMSYMFCAAASYANGGNAEGLENWVVHGACVTTEMFYSCPLSPQPGWYP